MAAIPARRAAVTSAVAPGRGAAARGGPPGREQTAGAFRPCRPGLPGQKARCRPVFGPDGTAGTGTPVDDQVVPARLDGRPGDVAQADPPSPARQHADFPGGIPPAGRRGDPGPRGQLRVRAAGAQERDHRHRPGRRGRQPPPRPVPRAAGEPTPRDRRRSRR